jgi:glycosyltransferase involved in cell wall biosynthesis
MKTVVVIPCYNEEKTITKVVSDFRQSLPDAEVIVMDNNSTDKSVALARDAGARIINVRTQGKGAVIQRMCEEVDADIYVIVDGDDTYSAADAGKLIAPVADDRADMVVGRRRISGESTKMMNRLGNVFFSRFLSFWSGLSLQDVLSGYRVVNRRFVENVPILCREFEVEAEMSFQAITKGMRIIEIETEYRQRPGGSYSKLFIWKDGYAILVAIVNLTRDLRPLTFFGLVALALWFFTLLYGAYVYYSPRMADLKDVVILISMFVIGWMFVLIGFSLHTINRRFDELMNLSAKKKRL